MKDIFLKLLDMISEGAEDGSLGRMIILLVASGAFWFVVYTKMLATPEGTIVYGIFNMALGYFFRNNQNPPANGGCAVKV